MCQDADASLDALPARPNTPTADAAVLRSQRGDGRRASVVTVDWGDQNGPLFVGFGAGRRRRC